MRLMKCLDVDSEILSIDLSKTKLNNEALKCICFRILEMTHLQDVDENYVF